MVHKKLFFTKISETGEWFVYDVANPKDVVFFGSQADAEQVAQLLNNREIVRLKAEHSGWIDALLKKMDQDHRDRMQAWLERIEKGAE